MDRKAPLLESIKKLVLALLIPLPRKKKFPTATTSSAFLGRECPSLGGFRVDNHSVFRHLSRSMVDQIVSRPLPYVSFFLALSSLGNSLGCCCAWNGLVFWPIVTNTFSQKFELPPRIRFEVFLKTTTCLPLCNYSMRNRLT